MRYLGIDFGLKRLGLASSAGTLAASIKTIEVTGFKDAIDKVEEFVRSERFDKIIIGLPEGNMSQVVLRFARALKKMRLDVELTDETLSSQKAIHQMIELNIPRSKRKVNDAYSAAIILQNYLDNLAK